ncbi:MAG: 2-(1,2-epoxy-1,2-dihydrophenyl)acetyl-CoA isomerase [Runella slithyformis]|nr:MAG: 2-(1,2-epoxy-1,2-dihydrophenyl)acetyl-CoA isomerase [Runella slithyformis]TAF92532.1 MAG: 2-(1,2-epoxy-1,2-dihydrophenyl)acetyl-CoA isomerase [Runella sp.]TAG25327.1 MAG: 2-(1,2-epoxy-1,2-dihydrophenyl)acetyl-CoA isomerase [Cytophagales bacterium]TAG42488.1 MAG: 2-(1,2-epoxy-1,2-dihydrophenyl)acetyl-CoA isomerase [Cytophagia bacterium]TAE92846.1 MAG: 2-(1,2-epoxy-1,2-dihydrophenyl)acetyl-CoA isomerase [Runella slithyformis]
MYENITYELSESVATITLNRPQVYNALSPGLIKDITAAIKAAEADHSVRVVVLTGTGNKAFCSGADLKAGMEAGLSLGESLRRNYNPMILAIRNTPKPVVCRLNGLAAGAGCSLALACDVIIAAESAYLCQIFVNIGLMPDAGSTFFLPRLVGMQRAFELTSTGRRIYAPEAAQWGLVGQCVADELLDEAVSKTVAYYKNAPTKAIGAMKQVLNQAVESDLAKMLEMEAENQDVLSQTSDAAEGIMAFLQKRKATYQGK